ncbi:MAG: PAS domain S-box protein [Chloroflexi bacterium]|nr:PAS domain S-box protein [Chloroflexota bacterium]
MTPSQNSNLLHRKKTRHSILTQSLSSDSHIEASTTFQDLFYDLVKQIPAISYACLADRVRTPLWISPQIEPLLGCSSAAWLADPDLWSKHIHADDRERVLAEYARCLDAKIPFSAEYRLITTTGDIKSVRDQAIIITDSSGQPYLIQGTIVLVNDGAYADKPSQWQRSSTEPTDPDVSINLSQQMKRSLQNYAKPFINKIPDARQAQWFFHATLAKRRQVEKRLENEVRKFQSVVEQSSEGIVLIDESGRIIEWNHGAEQILGLTQDQTLGQYLWDIQFQLAPPENKTPLLYGQLRKRIMLALETHQAPWFNQVSVMLLKRGDSVRSIESLIYPIQNENGFMIGSVIRDVTEQQRVANELRVSEARYRMLVETSPDPIALTDGNFRITMVNRQTAVLFGYDRADELLGKSAFEFIAPHDRLRAQHDTVLLNGETFQHIEYELIKKDGTIFPSECSLSQILDAEGKAKSYIIIVRDVSERKRLNAELEHSVEMTTRLYQLSGQILSATTLKETASLITHALREGFASDSASIFLFDSQGNAEFVHDDSVTKRSHQNFTPTPNGYTMQAMRSGKPIVVNDWKQVCLHVRDEGILATVILPLLGKSHKLGVVFLDYRLTRQFTHHQMELLSVFANQAALALERVRLNEQTRQHVRRLSALHKIDTAITASLDLSVVLKTLLTQVTTQLHVDAASIFRLNSKTQMLEYATGRGFRTKALVGASLLLGEGIAGRTALERRTLNLSNFPESQNILAYSPLLAGEDFVAFFSVPLMVKNQIKGVLNIFQRSPLEPNTQWVDFLETLAGQAAIAIDNAALFSGLQHSNAELELAYDTTIEGWSHALDLRDRETEGHTQRVTEMAMRLARRIGFSDAELVHLRRGALLHDIGKMGIPDDILFKPSSLTEDEWTIMRKHPIYAYELLMPIAYLRPALDIPYCHHEKWDGTGYPRGLKEDQIPLAARIFAVADIWDALSSDRPYRHGWKKDKVRQHILSLAGSYLDPQIVRVFLKEIERR